MSTSGYSAQALGTGLDRDRSHAWLRPLIMALAMGGFFVLCREPILRAALYLYHPEPGVAAMPRTYFRILILGAPLVLVGYVNLGWLMARNGSGQPFFYRFPPM